MNDITLSFIVVTYNHEKCIRRCLDSILAQDIRVPYEVVVGDDRSADGTWQILEEYKAKYPTVFTIYRVNSDDCHPLSLSDRASFNRGHAYQLVRGKYYAEIDGDDFLLPGDTYQKQVDMLEAHPECWLCKQEMVVIPDGESVENAKPYHPLGTFKDGQIITAEEYISNPSYFSQHQSFVFRRNVEHSPLDKLGLDYEDTTVTLFHLQYGPMICLDQSAYVYVEYPGGINARLNDDDRLVNITLLQLEHILYFPRFADDIFIASLPEFVHLFKEACNRRLHLSESGKLPLSRYQGFLFRYFEKDRHSFAEQVRFVCCRTCCLLLRKFSVKSNNIVRLVIRLCL